MISQAVFGLLLVSLVAAEITLQSTYTTSEDISSSKTVFVAQFTCSDCSENMNLFAEVSGKSLSVGKSGDGKSYQVSWSDEHKNAASGSYTVKLYNEAGFSDLKKAQRAGDEASSVKPLDSFTIQHKGVWKGAWIGSETVACLAASALLFFAYTKKNEIMA